MTTCSPSAASARASGCVHPARHQLAVQQHHPRRRRAPYSVYSSRSRPDSVSRKNWPMRSETSMPRNRSAPAGSGPGMPARLGAHMGRRLPPMTDTGRMTARASARLAAAVALLAGASTSPAPARSASAPRASRVAFWWPAAGLAVRPGRADAARAGGPAWPSASSSSSAAANLTGGRALDVSLLLRRWRTPPRRWSPGRRSRRGGPPGRGSTQLDDFLRLLAAAAARVPWCSRSAPRQRRGRSATGAFRRRRCATSVASHAAATLVIVPVALTWRHRPLDRALAELAAPGARPARS